MKKIKLLFIVLLIAGIQSCEKEICWECYDTIEIRLSDSYPTWHTTVLSTRTVLKDVICGVDEGDIRLYEQSNSYGNVIQEWTVWGQVTKFKKEWHEVKCKKQNK